MTWDLQIDRNHLIAFLFVFEALGIDSAVIRGSPTSTSMPGAPRMSVYFDVEATPRPPLRIVAGFRSVTMEALMGLLAPSLRRAVLFFFRRLFCGLTEIEINGQNGS